MRACLIALMIVMIARTASAQSAPHDAKADSMFRTIDHEAHRVHTVRVAFGIAALALGATVGGGAVYLHGKLGHDWSDGVAYGVDYTFLGAGGLLMIEGGVLLAMHPPPEQIRDQLAADIAAGDPRGGRVRAQQAIDDYPAMMRHRKHIAAGVCGGILALGLTSLYVMAKKDPLVEHTYGQVLLATGFIGITTGASGLGVSLLPVASPFEKLESGTTMAPVIAPTHGGGVVGFAGTF